MPGIRDGGGRMSTAYKGVVQRSIVVTGTIKCLDCGGSYMKLCVIKWHGTTHIHAQMYMYKNGEI